MHSGLIKRYRTSFLLVASGAFLAVSPGTLHAQSTAMTPELQAAKAALAKYSDPYVAIRDGFFSTLACVDFPRGGKDGPVEYPPGAMGVHFLNTANIGPVLDPAKPQVLIYEQVGDRLVLTAAEWFMPGCGCRW